MPNTAKTDQYAYLNERLEWAVEIASEAGDHTMQYFRRPELEVERKGDNSPVTIADKEAEQLLRKRIEERFPDDAILGEEFGEKSGTSGLRWVLDPIDGTKSFIHGVALYTTLVAVLEDDQPRIGVVNSPASGEMVYARTGGGCHYRQILRGIEETRQTSVSQINSLSESLVLTTESDAFRTDRSADAMPAYLELDKNSRVLRTWGDAYGYLMVATGRAEVMIDPIVNLWDVAALQPVITEAGGRFTDWKGNETVHSGEAVATNGQLHEEVLQITRKC